MRLRLTAVLVLIVTHALPAQRATSVDTTSSASVGRPLAGAVLGGAAGLVAGGLAGFGIGGNRCIDRGNPDTCQWLYGMLIGAGVGVTIGTPVGAHLLNHRRGELPKSLFASGAITAAGTALFFVLEANVHGAGRTTLLNTVAISVPILQVISATMIEMRPSRKVTGIASRGLPR